MLDKNTCLITLDGDLGIFDVARIEAMLPSPLDYSRVVIDCTAVTSMDSTVIAALMRYRRTVQIGGGDPIDVVVLANERLTRIFELTGVLRAFTVISPGGKPSDKPKL